MDTWDRPCVSCSVDLPNGGSWINGKGPLCSACSINTMRLLNGGQARFEVSEIIALRAELATLQAELASAREDSARLEAIQRENWTVHYCSMLSRWEVLTDHADPAHRKTYTGKTARAAIDEARKRDPRVDPRSGDELEFVTPEWNKERMRVVGTGEDMVRYQQKQLAVANGKWSGSSCDLARWRDWMAGSRVIHAAD